MSASVYIHHGLFQVSQAAGSTTIRFLFNDVNDQLMRLQKGIGEVAFWSMGFGKSWLDLRKGVIGKRGY